VARQPVPRNVPHRVGSAKARVAVYTRDHRPPEQIEAARAELAEANAEADVASWPPLSPEARAKIACIILSAGDGDAPAA
jgi:hypothetical protein